VKLDDIWKQYEAYTKAASDAARSLAIAGIATVWVFKVTDGTAFHLDRVELWAGASFVAALSCDLLQFVVGTAVYLALGTVRDRGPAANKDAVYPTYILWPIDLFFWLKFLFLGFGYFELLRTFLGRLG
jgi:hypothetical protein